MGRTRKDINAYNDLTRPGETPLQATEKSQYDSLGDGWGLFISFVRTFPDFLLDLFRSEDSNFGEEELIQRIIMRAKARYQYVDITGSRGLTKTSTTFKEEMVEMIVWPGTQAAYYGPSYKQLASIGKKQYMALEHDYHALCRYFTLRASGTDRFEIATPYNSVLSIAAMRGDNIHKVIAEEYAQEENPPFDETSYKEVVLPAVRSNYKVKAQRDPYYVRYKQHSITSAGRRQNHAYETRCRHYMLMQRGESAFVVDIPYDAVLLSGIREVTWAENLKGELTPDKWAREMESRYTGADENPIVSDSALSESRCLMAMEEHHCCKDYDNKLFPEDVIYVVGYDVSYADGAKNAKCACVVLKLTKQKDYLKRDRYMKQCVWVDDWLPMNAAEQALKLKSIWAKYTFPGSQAYIAIDAWQYGSSVLQSLMTDLGDGLAPLCIYDHRSMTEFELEGALPCIYPIKAGGVGTTDPDAEMIRYAELQFEYRNVQLLTSNFQLGMEEYKNLHRIKNDASDYNIYQPYKKTNELVAQIQNLKKVPNSAGVAEKRISHQIQRDSWSALKYALRLSQVLEREVLLQAVRGRSDWTDIINNYKEGGGLRAAHSASKKRLVGERKGGRIA